MFKKISLFLMFAAMTLTASAQYKITGYERTFTETICSELKYIIEGENSVFIYGTFTAAKEGRYSFSRSLAVFQNDMKYKAKNAIHLPLWDDAERPGAIVYAGEKVNFVIEFEKFSPEKPFDFLENENPKEGSNCLNIYGLQTETMNPEDIPNLEKFLDRYPVIMCGQYKDNGYNIQYIIRDGVYVSCLCTECEGGLFEPDYCQFLLEINNDSDHGIAFDFSQFHTLGYKTVRGKLEERTMVKYTPESYANYLAAEDYQEAKQAVGNGLSTVSSKLFTASLNSKNSEWENLGLRMASDIAKEVDEHNIQNYLAAHPKKRPDVLRSQSIASGEGISGYVAVENKKKNDYYIVHIPIDGYDFNFKWVK